MIVGVPKEIKQDEYRVAVAPAGVETLVAAGHRVLIEKGAGLGSGLSDAEYRAAGADVAEDAAAVWSRADMILKVKEPLPGEHRYFREGLLLFTFFHLAADPPLVEALSRARVDAVAYETIQLPDGTFPLLAPMSEIAGRMSIQEGAKYLEAPQGGRGVLLAGVPGVEPGTVVILGGGVVGKNAAKVAVGMGASVILLDVNHRQLSYLDDVFGGRLKTLASNSFNIRESVRRADLLVGGVYLAGARAPKLVSADLVRRMRPGSVIVDVAVDQGGCVETTRPTYHRDPTYQVDGVIHYCVANMPGAVSRTSTFALTHATLPYALALAEGGVYKAAAGSPALRAGINVLQGKVVYPAVAEAVGAECHPLDDLLKSPVSS
ncbi:MAG: alanine dehydrogenase [Candidatus Tectomicrobia bacterium]|nr:alanine dehydrogenase [Candidatus Tectomicrobia bacterium]